MAVKRGKLDIYQPPDLHQCGGETRYDLEKTGLERPSTVEPWVGSQLGPGFYCEASISPDQGAKDMHWGPGLCEGSRLEARIEWNGIANVEEEQLDGMVRYSEHKI